MNASITSTEAPKPRRPKNVRLLRPISERLIRCRRLRPNSAKTYGNLVHGTCAEKRMCFRWPSRRYLSEICWDSRKNVEFTGCPRRSHRFRSSVINCRRSRLAGDIFFDEPCHREIGGRFDAAGPLKPRLSSLRFGCSLPTAPRAPGTRVFRKGRPCTPTTRGRSIGCITTGSALAQLPGVPVLGPGRRPATGFPFRDPGGRQARPHPATTNCSRILL